MEKIISLVNTLKSLENNKVAFQFLFMYFGFSRLYRLSHYLHDREKTFRNQHSEGLKKNPGERTIGPGK